MEIRPIAYIQSDFREKFGIPRQSGIVEQLKARIVFEPEYRDPNALLGLEGYSHIWLLWEFSASLREGWSPTVLPPRLGGKKHMGVFATRSPFRPNQIGLSCVRLLGIEHDRKYGNVLVVGGADLMDGTPIYDIKPYLAYTDSHPDANCGFAARVLDYELEVEFPQNMLDILPAEKREAALGILKQDPRPSYQNDPDRRYGTAFAGYDIRFHVRDGKLTVCEVEKLEK